MRPAPPVWREAVAALARGAAAVFLLASELVVLAGGLGRAGDELTPRLTRRLDTLLGSRRVLRNTVSRLADRAGCAGAGLLARDLAGPS